MLFKTHCVIQATSNSIQDMCFFNCCCLAESLRYDISEQCVVCFFWLWFTGGHHPLLYPRCVVGDCIARCMGLTSTCGPIPDLHRLICLARLGVLLYHSDTIRTIVVIIK